MAKSLRQARAELRMIGVLVLLAVGIGLIATALMALYGHDRSGIVAGSMALVIILALEWIRRPMRRALAVQEEHAAKVLSAMNPFRDGASPIDSHLTVLWIELGQVEFVASPGKNYWHGSRLDMVAPLAGVNALWATDQEANKDLLLGRAMDKTGDDSTPLRILHLTPVRDLRLANFRGVSLANIAGMCQAGQVSLPDALAKWATENGLDGVCGIENMEETVFAQPLKNLFFMEAKQVDEKGGPDE